MPQPEEVFVTGTLEHLDPTTLVIALRKTRGADYEQLAHTV
jgi:hypothetical protein